MSWSGMRRGVGNLRGVPYVVLGIGVLFLALFFATLIGGGTGEGWFLTLAAIAAGLAVLLASRRQIPQEEWNGWHHFTPTPKPARHAPRQIPAAQSLFVGRQQLIRQVCEHLNDSAPGPKVVVLQGVAGVGKTSLAISVAHAVAKSYPDGQLFASVRSVDTAKVLHGFLRAFRDGQPPSDPDALLLAYRELTADRAVIAVLDDASGAAGLLDLIPRGRRCAALITSIDPLTVTDNQLSIHVQPLRDNDSIRILSEVAGAERVQAEDEQATQIAEHLGGIPLAIRAAAATLAATPDTRLSAALRRYQELMRSTGGSGEYAPLDFAYSQLPSHERRTLLAIAELGEQTIERWQLTALLGGTNTVTSRSADRLCQASFLLRGSSDAAGVPRYRIHPRILAFAKRRLDLDLSEQERAKMRRGLRQARAEMVGRDVDLRQVRRGPLTELDAGRILSAINLARDSVEKAREGDNRGAEGLALVVFAELRTELGGFEAAEDLATSALACAPDDSLVKVRAMRCRARLARRRRQFPQAKKLLTEALEIAADHRSEHTQCLRDYATTLTHLKEYEQAEEALAAAMRAADDHPTPMMWLKPKLFLTLSRLRESQQRWDESDDAISDGIEIAQREELDLWLAWLELRRAEMLLAMGEWRLARTPDSDAAKQAAMVDWHRASRSGFESMERFAKINHRYGKANAGMITGKAFRKLKQADRARRLLEEALETFVNCGDKWAEAETRRLLAHSIHDEETLRARLLETANSMFISVGDLTSARSTSE